MIGTIENYWKGDWNDWRGYWNWKDIEMIEGIIEMIEGIIGVIDCFTILKWFMLRKCVELGDLCGLERSHPKKQFYNLTTRTLF